jgi:hypothetical protein
LLTDLAALLDLLKAKGVTRFEGCYGEKARLVKLDLSPPADVVKDEKSEPDPERCACGHPMTEHQGGGCLRGCDDKECNP